MSSGADPEERVFAELRSMVGAATARRIVELFLELRDERIGAVRDAIAGGDAAAAALTLHSLKSSAGMLGAVQLQEVAQTMEALARAGRVEELASRFDELERLYARAASSLRARIDAEEGS